jgi:hypothetical protein
MDTINLLISEVKSKILTQEGKSKYTDDDLLAAEELVNRILPEIRSSLIELIGESLDDKNISEKILQLYNEGDDEAIHLADSLIDLLGDMRKNIRLNSGTDKN